MSIHPLLAQTMQGQPLDEQQAVAAFELVMTGQASPVQVGALLAMLAQREPTLDEITGAARVMRDKVTRVEVPDGLTVIDTCGTGGDHSNRFNVSTAAGLVAAAAGRPKGVGVAKHGNRSVTSKSGSSQVLEMLGVKLFVNPMTQTRCIDEAGFCFCFAQAHHPAMKYAGPVRAELGFRTIFNVLGPLTNPAGAARQIMGVYDAALTESIATVLGRLGSDAAMVLRGQTPDGAGMGEISTCGPTRISQLHDGKIDTYELDVTTLGITACDPDDLAVSDPASSAKVIASVLAGDQGAPRDIVLINAAAALLVAGAADELAHGLTLAAEAIDSGAARRVLDTVVALTSADPTPAP